MLRITKEHMNGGPVMLRIEGRVVAEWAALLERECRELERPAGEVILDFKGVTFADARGVRVLCRLQRLGTRLANCPTFIQELLGTSSRRSSP